MRSTDYYYRATVNIELDDSVQLVTRDVYNILMLFGDVGGLSGLLYSLGGALVGILSFQSAENFVVQSLYKAKKHQ